MNPARLTTIHSFHKIRVSQPPIHSTINNKESYLINMTVRIRLTWTCIPEFTQVKSQYTRKVKQAINLEGY